MKKKPILLLTLAVLQVALILGSWLYSAALPDSTVRPILSDSGIRWFFGTFVANLSSPLLIYIILLDIAVGSCVRSGFWRALRTVLGRGAGSAKSAQKRQPLPPSKGGWGGSLLILLFEVIVILLLTVPRHAILLSATGDLFPSSFSAALVPILAFMLLTASITYGMFSGTFHNYRDAVTACLGGGRNLKFLLALYVLAFQLWKMIVYVVGE